MGRAIKLKALRKFLANKGDYNGLRSDRHYYQVGKQVISDGGRQLYQYMKKSLAVLAPFSLPTRATPQPLPQDNVVATTAVEPPSSLNTRSSLPPEGIKDGQI